MEREWAGIMLQAHLPQETKGTLVGRSRRHCPCLGPSISCQGRGLCLPAQLQGKLSGEEELVSVGRNSQTKEILIHKTLTSSLTNKEEDPCLRLCSHQGQRNWNFPSQRNISSGLTSNQVRGNFQGFQISSLLDERGFSHWAL